MVCHPGRFGGRVAYRRLACTGGMRREASDGRIGAGSGGPCAVGAAGAGLAGRRTGCGVVCRAGRAGLGCGAVECRRGCGGSVRERSAGSNGWTGRSGRSAVTRCGGVSCGHGLERGGLVSRAAGNVGGRGWSVAGIGQAWFGLSQGTRGRAKVVALGSVGREAQVRSGWLLGPIRRGVTSQRARRALDRLSAGHGMARLRAALGCGRSWCVPGLGTWRYVGGAAPRLARRVEWKDAASGVSRPARHGSRICSWGPRAGWSGELG